MYNNYRKWRNHKRGQPQNNVLDTSNFGEFTDVSVFLVYLLLQSSITSAIIEVRAMIVTPINE